MSRRLFMTGATGAIGGVLVELLLADGWDIVVATHNRSPGKALPEGRGVETRVDLTDVTALTDVLVGCDAVCHLAAFIPPDMSDPTHAEECLRVNATIPRCVAEAALLSRVKRAVFFSSGQIYRWQARPVDENAPVYPADRATWYLGSKLLGEIYVEHLRRTRSLPALTLRLASCYGTSGDERSAPAAFLRSALGGSSLQVRDAGIPASDFVLAEDVARAAVCALRGGAPGIYNVGSGTAHSVLELARAVASIFPDRPPALDVQPVSQPVPSSFAALDTTKARQAWQWNPRPLAEGLQCFRRLLERAA